MKRLITNADDFGFTSDVNAGIVHSHRTGILTSTTLMANGDAFDHAIRLARETPSLDVGCHLVLVQGRSLVTGKPFPGTVMGMIRGIQRRQIEPYLELRAQVERIVSAGIRPTHLDSHKHTHIAPAIFRVAARLAAEFQIPYVRLPIDSTLPCAEPFRRYYKRLAAPFGVAMTDHFVGFRLTGSLTERTLLAALQKLQDGTTEFMCHPGFLGHELGNAETRLKESRIQELEALTSPRVREYLNESGVRLHPFGAAVRP